MQSVSRNPPTSYEPSGHMTKALSKLSLVRRKSEVGPAAQSLQLKQMAQHNNEEHENQTELHVINETQSGTNVVSYTSNLGPKPRLVTSQAIPEEMSSDISPSEGNFALRLNLIVRLILFVT